MALVSGWDSGAPGVPPKDLQDIDEAKEMLTRPSYFEKLEKQKTIKRGAAGSPTLVTMPSLRRDSLGLERATSLGTPTAAMTLPVQDNMFGRASYQQSSTMPVNRGTSSISTSGGLAFSPPQTYAPTDWESEIKALQGSRGSLERRPPHLGRTSVDSYLSQQKTQHVHPGPPVWWAQLDTGALNRGAEPDEPPGPKHALKGVKLDWVGSNLH